VKITVSARNADVSPALRAAAEEKLGRLARLSSGLDRAWVHFHEERNPRIVEREVCDVTLDSGGRHLRCKAIARDGFVAIDKAVLKLEQQLQREKTKVLRRDAGYTAPRAVRRAS
jgi:putative sigma-54 modulation protein